MKVQSLPDRLADLRTLLLSLGYNVHKQRLTENTLRVYVRKPAHYPLLNPYFTGSRLTIATLSKDPSLDRIFEEYESSKECKFVRTAEHHGEYYEHGSFVLNSTDLPTIAPCLSALHSFLSRTT